MAVSFSDLDIAVQEQYLPGIVNQVFKARPLLVRLLSRHNVILRGGLRIRQPILYGELPGGSFSGSGPFDTSYRETHAYCEADWKNLYVNVTIPGTDLAKADSDREIIGLLNPKMEAATLTMQKMMATQIFGDGTGNGGLDLDGLKNAIDDGTNYPTYLGINRNEKPWWKANYDGVGGTFSLDLVQNGYGLATDGDEMPDLIVCNQTIWNKFWSRVSIFALVKPSEFGGSLRGDNTELSQ
ncbi:MAG: phage major capsid protein [Candidatus Aenigmatarchaeota archaeon]